MAPEDDRKSLVINPSFSSLELETTYGGMMEGSRETCSNYVLEKVRRNYPQDSPNNGYALIVPEGPFLPYWTCKAYLSSNYRFRDEDDGSRLSVCWFVDKPKDSIQEMIDDLMKQVDWHERARRYDMCDF